MTQDPFLRRVRRSHERFQIHAPARLITAGEKERPAMIKNLSVQGAGLVCDYPLKEKETLEVRIWGPFFKGTVTRRAKVAWVREIGKDWYRCGLDFGMDNLLPLRPSA